MSDSPQIALVRRFYDALGDPEVTGQVLSPEVQWDIAEGFPYGGVYVGLDSVRGEFFKQLLGDFDEFRAIASEFFESGDRVFTLGNYVGRAKATGKSFTARFAHVWTIGNGKIVRFQHCADTLQLARALAG